MQEAKDSSEIENIITTHDDLYKEELFSDTLRNPASKEVCHYVQAVKKGFSLIKTKSLLTSVDILEIHKELEHNNAGFRKLPGTELKNQRTGETIYTPPQDYEMIVSLMSNLENFINNPSLSFQISLTLPINQSKFSGKSFGHKLWAHSASTELIHKRYKNNSPESKKSILYNKKSITSYSIIKKHLYYYTITLNLS